VGLDTTTAGNLAAFAIEGARNGEIKEKVRGYLEALSKLNSGSDPVKGPDKKLARHGRVPGARQNIVLPPFPPPFFHFPLHAWIAVFLGDGLQGPVRCPEHCV